MVQISVAPPGGVLKVTTVMCTIPSSGTALFTTAGVTPACRPA